MIVRTRNYTTWDHFLYFFVQLGILLLFVSSIFSFYLDNWWWFPCQSQDGRLLLFLKVTERSAFLCQVGVNFWNVTQCLLQLPRLQVMLLLHWTMCFLRLQNRSCVLTAPLLLLVLTASPLSSVTRPQYTVWPSNSVAHRATASTPLLVLTYAASSLLNSVPVSPKQAQIRF